MDWIAEKCIMKLCISSAVEQCDVTGF